MMAADGGGGAAPVAFRDSPGIFRPKRWAVWVRSMVDGEEDLLGAVFFRSVHHGAARAYSEAQRDAWAPQAPSGAGWVARLAGQSVVVAECDGRVRGFMSVDLDMGHLDFAFVERDVQGQGVSDVLYAVIENRARASGLTRLTSDASLLARPFFERMGWRVLAAQSVERRGVTLQNWRMEKRLL